METFALLYPVIDCLNHRSGARVSWNFDDGNFSLSTTEPLQAGKEIWNNYGAKSNEECVCQLKLALASLVRLLSSARSYNLSRIFLPLLMFQANSINSTHGLWFLHPEQSL